MFRVPFLEDIPPELHGAIAYPKSQNPRDLSATDQLLKETVGKKVGNVPVNICGLFRMLKDNGEVREIHW